MVRRSRLGGAFRRRSGSSNGRELRFESLESRAMLAITVNTLVDEADGSIVDGDISLRDAIAQAPSGETINFAAALTSGGPAKINLAIALKELVINKSLTITGPGANLLTIDASSTDPTPNVNNGNGTRVFNVDDGVTSRSTVLIQALTLTGADSSGYGGAIRSLESLTVQDMVFRQNSAANGGAIGAASAVFMYDCEFFENNATQGGGALQISSSLFAAEIYDCTIRNNTTPGPGAGIYIAPNRAIGVKIQTTLIQDNTAGTNGGGVVSESALTLTDSSIVGNHAEGNGGGLLANHSGTVLTQVTISGNTADGGGGGIYATQPLSLQHSTLADNTANADGNVQASAVGGGIQYVDSTNPLDTMRRIALRHTIVADNVRGSGAGVADNLFSGTAAGGGNYFQFNASLVETYAGFNPSAVLEVGSASQFDVDAQLAALANNGGPTLPGNKALMTHALLPGSPAINAGNSTFVAGAGGVPQFDERGSTFGRVLNGRIDIGAFEFPTSAVSGDYNRNGKVDAADYTMWRDTLGSTTMLVADGSGPTVGTPNGVVDQADYNFWTSKYGSVAGGQGAGSGEPGGSGLAASQAFTGIDSESAEQHDDRHEGTAGQASNGTLADSIDLLLSMTIAGEGADEEADFALPADGETSTEEADAAFDRVFALLGQES